MIMASGISRGRVRTTTTTAELPNMAAIFQKKTHTALVYRVVLFRLILDIHAMINRQLSKQGIR